jgi:4-aminobutyrate aminotransferase/4-aminobutyrate aminotransferase/(S)-3-amino-2-methylpropionate transaminase
MNCHDFATPVKEKLVEKVANLLPGKLNGIQLYSDGATAVEAGLRAARVITGKHEFISGFRDFHGKTLGAVSCARMARGNVLSYSPTRTAGFYMVPRPDPYRPLFTRPTVRSTPDGPIFDFNREFIFEGTAGNVGCFCPGTGARLGRIDLLRPTISFRN